MGILGGEEAFFLGGLDLAGAGGDLVGDELELRVIGTGEDWALNLVRAGDEILACSSALARRSERD